MKANVIQYKWYTQSVSPFLQDRFIRCYEGEEEGMRLNEVEKDQLVDTDILTYLVICLNHCLYCLFAKHDFTSYVEQNDLEKYLNKGSVPLSCWLPMHFCKISFACLPHLVGFKVQNENAKWTQDGVFFRSSSVQQWHLFFSALMVSEFLFQKESHSPS